MDTDAPIPDANEPTALDLAGFDRFAFNTIAPSIASPDMAFLDISAPDTVFLDTADPDSVAFVAGIP